MTEQRLKGARLVLVAVLALAGLAVLAPAAWQPAIAGTPFPPIFAVADVPVDATANSAMAAREAARAQGAATALRQLLQRLTAPADWPRLPPVDSQTATNLILDFQVSHERSSAVRYVASYTYRFNPGGVRQLLQQNGIAFTEIASKPVVIVPVLKDGDTSHLWDDPNPWRDAWNAIPGKSGLVPWTMPAGDLTDVSMFDLPDTAQPSPDKLQALSQHYDGGDVVVALATLSQGANGAHLDITVSRYGAAGTADTDMTSVDSAQADSTLYEAGVHAAITLLEGDWKRQTLTAVPATTSGEPQTIVVNVPIASAGDWARVQNRLANVPPVRAVSVQVMTRTAIRAQITVASDEPTLKVALAQQDLTLTDGEPYATLALRASAPLQPPAPSPQ